MSLELCLLELLITLEITRLVPPAWLEAAGKQTLYS